MTEFFDVIYEDRKYMSPVDFQRGFFNANVESLDAPSIIPAGSTNSYRYFHAPSFTYRAGEH